MEIIGFTIARSATSCHPLPLGRGCFCVLTLPGGGGISLALGHSTSSPCPYAVTTGLAIGCIMPQCLQRTTRAVPNHYRSRATIITHPPTSSLPGRPSRLSRKLEHGTIGGTLNRPPSQRLVGSHYCSATRRFRSLVKRVDTIWEARKQAKYIEAGSKNASVDSAAIRLLQRKYNLSPPARSEYPRSSTGSALGMSPGSTHHRRSSRTRSGF